MPKHLGNQGAEKGGEWVGKAKLGLRSQKFCIYFNKWHWLETRISPLHLEVDFIISSTERELPAYLHRGGPKEPEVVTGS